MAEAGELPDVDISDKGVKISPLDNSVPSAVSPLADLIYNMLPHPKITEILDEVERWTAFTRHFTHLKNPLTRPQDNRLLLTTIGGRYQSGAEQNGRVLSGNLAGFSGKHTGMVHPR